MVRLTDFITRVNDLFGDNTFFASSQLNLCLEQAYKNLIRFLKKGDVFSNDLRFTLNVYQQNLTTSATLLQLPFQIAEEIDDIKEAYIDGVRLTKTTLDKIFAYDTNDNLTGNISRDTIYYCLQNVTLRFAPGAGPGQLTIVYERTVPTVTIDGTVYINLPETLLPLLYDLTLLEMFKLIARQDKYQIYAQSFTFNMSALVEQFNEKKVKEKTNA